MARWTDFAVVEEPVDDQTHLLTLTGEVDALTAPQLGRRLLDLIDAGKRHLVVDLGQVTFFDSAAIGVLLNALRQLPNEGSRMALVCPTERARRPFEVAGLLRHLPIFSSREEAFGSLAAA